MSRDAANEVTGANAGGLRRWQVRALCATRIDQFCRYVKASRHTAFVLATCALGLSGCVFWRSNTLRSTDESSTLTLGINAAGFLLTGPCSTPYVGKISEAEYVIKLH